MKTTVLLVWAVAFCSLPVAADSLALTFRVKQSKGLPVAEGDEVTLILTYSGQASGRQGGAETVYEDAISELRLEAGTRVMMFSGPYGIKINTVRKQWYAAGASFDTSGEGPHLQMFAAVLTYPEGVLSENTLAPPAGATSISGGAATRTDLLMSGRLENRKEWSVAGDFISMGGRN